MMPINITKWKQKYERLDKVREDILDSLANLKAEIPVVNPGSKIKRAYFNTPKKALEARLARINLSIRELESGYNERYNYYASWRDKCQELENDFINTENALMNISSQCDEIRMILVMQAQANTPPTLEHLMNLGTLSDLNKQFLLLATKKETLKKQLAYYENKSVQTLKPLYQLKDEMLMGTIETYDRLPAALEEIKIAALKYQKKHDSDHVRNEPKEPNPMDEILKSFAIDNKKIN